MATLITHYFYIVYSTASNGEMQKEYSVGICVQGYLQSMLSLLLLQYPDEKLACMYVHCTLQGLVHVIRTDMYRTVRLYRPAALTCHKSVLGWREASSA